MNRDKYLHTKMTLTGLCKLVQLTGLNPELFQVRILGGRQMDSDWLDEGPVLKTGSTSKACSGFESLALRIFRIVSY